MGMSYRNNIRCIVGDLLRGWEMDVVDFGQCHMESLVIGNLESSGSATGGCEIGSDSLLSTVVVILVVYSCSYVCCLQL